MFRGKSVAVVVPAHNEARLIVRAVGQIPPFVDRVIVVDDASTDDTMSVLRRSVRRPGLVCIQHRRNLGVGAAIVTGYGRAMDLGCDVVAVMAGDAQMDPADLPSLLGPVVDGEADYSKGDRLSWPKAWREMPLLRFLGNHVLSWLTRLTSGYRDCRDSQCGYTAVAAAVLARLDLGGLYPRYGFPNDMLAHLHTAEARLAQVTVRPVYGSEVSGISLYTAVARVPMVLFRSWWRRRRRGSRSARRLVLEPARRKS